MIIILMFFEGMASKLEKIGPIFFKFQSISILAILATDGRKQFQCRKIVFNNKTRALFLEFSWCEDMISLLKIYENSVT